MSKQQPEAQPAAQQGAAYAALPTSYAGRVYEEGFLIGTCPLYTADQLRDFADATHALRASHGQAPAGAGEPTEQQILEAAFAPAQPAPEASRFGSPELQAMILARCMEKDRADSVQEDAARYRWLCCKFGQTRLPCALENMLEHGYIADGKLPAFFFFPCEKWPGSMQQHAARR